MDNIHSGPVCCEQTGTAPIVTRPATQQQHRVSWVGWVVGGPGYYVVTTTRVEVELGCDNISFYIIGKYPCICNIFAVKSNAVNLEFKIEVNPWI